MQQESYIERNWKKVLVVAVLFLLLMNVKNFILGRSALVKLQPADPLVGQISQAFTSSASNALPIYGKDYTLENTKYFENNDWVVTTIKPKTTDFNQSFLVMQKKNGVYMAVLGPGSIFPSTITDNLPDKVALYLYSLGAVYDPSN